MRPPGNRFLAVVVPAGEVQVALLARLAALDPAIRTVRSDSLHLTIQFLGRFDNALEPAVRAAVTLVAARHHGFALAVGGLGGFPSANRPSVVWLGVNGGKADLSALAGALASALAARGLPWDRRPLRPHCTLARIGDGLSLASRGELRTLLRSRPTAGAFAVSELRLLESMAVPGEPNRYITRATFPLGDTVAGSHLEGAAVPGVKDREPTHRDELPGATLKGGDLGSG
ncbi:MAG: RNA 2',3'-cyclic phosphodiesterase [Candidatus Dormibacteria bacterium]